MLLLPRTEHGAARPERSRRTSTRALAVSLKRLVETRQWVAATLSREGRVVLPSRDFEDTLSTLVKSGTDTLGFANYEELSPDPRTPFRRSIDIRRLGGSKSYDLELVPGADHGPHNAEGRNRAVAILDEYVLPHFVAVAPQCGAISSRTERP